MDVLHLDEWLVAVDKPPGLLSVPSPEAPDRVTCLSRVRDLLGQRLYPVHRLDRGTSGVLLFARSPEAAGRVAAGFRTRLPSKRYLALVRGWVAEEGEVDHPLAEGLSLPAVEALTRYRRLQALELAAAVGRYATARYSLVEVAPVTGRRHQIRRHLKHLRHPVIGDRGYGDRAHNRFFAEALAAPRMWLHASCLELPHPFLGGPLVVRAPLGAPFERVLARLGGEPPEPR